MSSVKIHHSRRRRRSRESIRCRHSESHRRGSSSSERSKGTPTVSPRRRYSNDHQDNQIDERSRSTKRQQEVNNRDNCVGGPDIFASVLGPTPDETFLLGLQTFLGFCTGYTEGEPNRQQAIEDDEGSVASQNEPSVDSYRDHSSDRTDGETENIKPKISEQSALETVEETEIENTTESQFLANSTTVQESTVIESEPVHTSDTNQSKNITVTTESQTDDLQIRRSCHCQHNSTSDKFSDTSDLTVSTMLNSEHSSQTDYPSIESRTAQTAAEAYHFC